MDKHAWNKKDVGKESVEGKGKKNGQMVKGQQHCLRGFMVFITHQFTISAAVVSLLCILNNYLVQSGFP